MDKSDRLGVPLVKPSHVRLEWHQRDSLNSALQILEAAWLVELLVGKVGDYPGVVLLIFTAVILHLSVI